MTDEEIIEALDLCTQQNGSIPCYDCPRWDDDEQECKGIDYTATLDLINRQKAVIEKLTKKVEELSEVLSDTIRIRYAEAKSEAYKEFAKRLKNKIKTECNPYGKPTFDYDTSISIMRYIDNLVKEMIGDIE